MDDRAFSEIRDMLDQGIAIKETREQVSQGFRDVADALTDYHQALDAMRQWRQYYNHQ